MRQKIDLLNGPVFSSLTKLALPIMATSLVQMAYNLTDMIWIGRISSDAVASVGAAGMYMWFANGIASLAKMGGQVKVGHALGAREDEKAVSYARNAIQLALFFGLLYGFLSIVFQVPLIGFFRLNSPAVIKDAQVYLAVTCGLVVFSFLNQVLTGILTAMGNSRTSLLATATGLIINIVLDPVLIFGVGPFPHLGVLGAAIATVFAQAVVTCMFILAVKNEPEIFLRLHLLTRPSLSAIQEIIRIGLPSSLQNMLFTAISMIIARMVAGFGDAAVAVQKVGSQIESISWMTSDGFAAAVNSFIAQNFGAGNLSRARKGYQKSMVVVLLWGAFCTFVLIVFPEPIFRIFIPEADILPMGVDYLRILGVSQLFMCMEITTAGAFAGLGKTLPPSIVSITLNCARIPLAFALISTPLGLNGIWWSITISSIFKGIVLVLVYQIRWKKQAG
ncbi:MATE family efflux transporter [Sellimonas caecigallum]|uniref:Probable multidrug resistance protein NorM n=1 Tax=Sellimonas caecigallum TaxID=2592333 RepID=A0ABS7L964_9FIRM|nr:MATE family efflux transporter [Sellimonas caecigallum]MBY0759641.1 MATE family efflux transporter [Sellimonas caecigallum]